MELRIRCTVVGSRLNAGPEMSCGTKIPAAATMQPYMQMWTVSDTYPAEFRSDGERRITALRPSMDLFTKVPLA
jgi:hypothetical protein